MRALLLAGVVLCLSGCSASTFFYNRADWFVAREVDGYVDLSTTQRDALRAAVRDWQTWHRESALPRWHADTRTLARALEAPLSESEVAAWTARAENHADAALDQVMVRLVPLIATLDDDQIAAFWEAFDAARAERREKFEKGPEAFQRRVVKQARRWIGRPTAEQRAILDEWAEAQLAARTGDADVLAARDAWRRAQIKALLTDREAADALHRWRVFLGLQEADDPSAETVASQREAAHDRAAVRRWQALLAVLSGTLTERQRARLTDKVGSYAEDFQRWADG